MGMRLLTVILIIVTLTQAKAQQYRFHQYRVEQGLPSDVIKAVTQDSLGFLWIATDDGLVKYDGIKFTTYKTALRSNFAKGFLHTRDGRLLAFGDLDVIEIQNYIDTVIFKTLLRGQRYFSDTTVWFPKSMYQDKSGDIWIAEPKSVIKYRDGKFKRYDFGEENRSPVFVRSFSFFEDEEHNFYTISYSGNLFWYDAEHDQFIQQNNFKLPEEVSQVLYTKKRLLIAARQGLFTAEIKNRQAGSVVNMFPVRSVSNLLLAPDSSIFVSTYTEDLYKISLDDGFTWESLYFNFNGISSCFISDEDDIWVATDKGLVLVQTNLFTLADLNSQTHYVEGIAYDQKNHLIYYANKEALIKIKPASPDEDWEREILLDDKSNYFQSLQFSEKGLWATTSWQVLLLQDERVVKTWDFSKDGNFVNHLFVDSKENVWLSQAGSKYVTVITDVFEIKRYELPDLQQNDVNYICEGDDGIYAVANGAKTYLFFKHIDSTTFKNISPEIPFDVRGDFTVGHLAIQDGKLWLASSEGLLHYDNKRLTRLEFGETFERYPVSSVEIFDKENILFSNSYGLFRYNTISGEYWLYDENSGLPSNTITAHGIFITPDKNVWVGTSYGLAFATKSITKNKMTRKPYCVEARVNGKTKPFAGGLYTDYGAYITLQFSPISFPENKINVQWRSSEDAQWIPMENKQLSLSNLSSGEHHIFVRAKKNTGLGWSEPSRVSIVVDAPYWKKAEFIFLIVFLVIMIAWASYGITSTIMNQRKEYLEAQINERTQELQRANEELTLRNTELDRFVYSASHDLSAPLKSILGLILVAKMDQPGEMHVQYLSMIERSVHKLEDFIEEVVTYSRNTRMSVKHEVFSFKEFVDGLLQDHEYSPNFKHIQFHVEDHLEAPMISDVTRMKIILNNLLSNAIKFHWIDNCRDPFIKIAAEREHDTYLIRVEDNGRGISEEHIKRVFEMFYRATDDAQGSGLGLYILKESVIKLGGTVEAMSRIDAGTVFIVRLPVPDLNATAH